MSLTLSLDLKDFIFTFLINFILILHFLMIHNKTILNFKFPLIKFVLYKFNPSRFYLSFYMLTNAKYHHIYLFDTNVLKMS